jgi:glutathione S-transferase
MSITLYDLAGAEADRRFSPYCWRTKMAMAHKGVPFETIPWRFTDKETIAFSGQPRVPVIVDDGRTIADSWAIANYLEDTYPDRPSLFAGAGGRTVSRFVNDWADGVLVGAIIPLIMVDLFGHIAEQDKAYFRRSREERFGTTLEALSADRDQRVLGFRKGLQFLRTTLGKQPFLGGAAPAYADYIVFGNFQWARCVSPFQLLEPDDPIAVWRGALLDRFGGMARRAPGYD